MTPALLWLSQEFVGVVTRMAHEKFEHLVPPDGGLAVQTHQFITRYLEPQVCLSARLSHTSSHLSPHPLLSSFSFSSPILYFISPSDTPHSSPLQVRALLVDDFTHELENRPVQLVLYRHRARLSAIFAAFAGLESVRAVASPGSLKGSSGKSGGMADSPVKRAAAAKAVSAVNAHFEGGGGGGDHDPLASLYLSLEGWESMLREGNMLDGRFTMREATYIFVKVNIQDEVNST